MFPGIKKLQRYMKVKKLIEEINECEMAIKYPDQDYFPHGITDYCDYNPQTIRRVLTNVKKRRIALLKELKRLDYRSYRKLYHNEHRKEREIDKAIEKCCK